MVRIFRTNLAYMFVRPIFGPDLTQHARSLRTRRGNVGGAKIRQHFHFTQRKLNSLFFLLDGTFDRTWLDEEAPDCFVLYCFPGR